MPLTIERAALVKRLVAQGYPDDRIADVLRIARETVFDIRHRAARDDGIRAASARGMSNRQIAKDFGLCKATVARNEQH